MTASPTDDLASAERRIQDLTKELAEASRQQSATSEILRVISSSPNEPHRVFQEIAASAALDAYDAGALQRDGDHLRVVGHYGPMLLVGPVGQGKLPLTRGSLIGRVVLDRQTLHVSDMQAEADEYPYGSEVARQFGFHTILAVRLMRAGEAIGLINVRRTELRPFTDRQIELLKTFADQAVIAIENTRLFEEVQERTRDLTETLEQQTATSEVLSVISSSPTYVQPVLDAIVKTCCAIRTTP